MTALRWTIAVGGAAMGSLATGLAARMLYRRALARNPVGVLDAADFALRAGRSGVRRVARARFGPDPQQVLEVFVPRGAHPRRDRRDTASALPVVVFIHGGAWDSGRVADYRFIARTLAPLGVMVVLAGYRLLPHGRWPVMLEDGAKALRWVADHVGPLGGDPGRVVLMGHSAGGYNALALALDRRWMEAQGLDAGALAGVIALAAPSDFLPLDDPASIAAFGHCANLRQTQPIDHAHALRHTSGKTGTRVPPLLLVHGANDTRVLPRHSLALADAMTGAGHPTRAAVLEGINHEQLITAFARPFARETRPLDAVKAFLAEVFPSREVHSASQ
ncbi:alpha/beta hydrolase [Novosphingobium pituita]|uniref:Alpha/beta hydrolase n=1 Tax=Novosphingobium pituita TaxID=3056842 RepID=A0ABQ6P8M3_9SPHN|nr:alpha/beta hydrolase [Novosphingobium sp. IK01]GMM61600.1 alpha/beta hydrolase [Novosphingobium sp. IK01]